MSASRDPELTAVVWAAEDRMSDAEIVLQDLLVFKEDMDWAFSCLEMLSISVPLGAIMRERRSAVRASGVAELPEPPDWVRSMGRAKEALGVDANHTSLCSYALRDMWNLPQPAYEKRAQVAYVRPSWLVTNPERMK